MLGLPYIQNKGRDFFKNVLEMKLTASSALHAHRASLANNVQDWLEKDDSVCSRALMTH